jgi:hypothetical protein
MNRFIDISLMLVSGIIEASNDEGCIRENQHAVNKLRKERVFTQSGPLPDTTQDSVRGRWLGFTAVAISGN